MTGLIDIDPTRPVLIAGPTACGKSALALRLAESDGGQIINADALQVFANWRVLTARPSPEEESRAPHRLYGHVGPEVAYSVGHWLRDVAPLLQNGPRPIIVGGTGLYFTALTEGLADIPETPASLREDANAIRAAQGHEAFLPDLDQDTLERLDTANPMRVQRAWEVQRATGRSLAAWQDETPPPLLPLSECAAIALEAPKEWLNPRIEMRFDQMLAEGALDEVRANLDGWMPERPSSRAIGAPELVAYLRGELTLDGARDAAVIATRQYAKRQRTWFRARMRDWHWHAAAEI
ncbi:tRNA (adenosine(37)-N6)-dimethylallyltransferase MiaA [Roseovarius rhodophyticola]|uniref:tRNA dimethylallyltransferase n=1 Tax=Roseovarius rhodophyticola TaxID=3080827 RepID=A0ABZ2TFR5_9RHOB|nr:tRNA (adenosine(37)-N6)-dimethylallyltransferase MiaA [Roseovarius sp. W115]MDV2928209.1 tRNA (adenosine(37)-N6)-dimethylallyltransferase MiaA [Roseovarius sp. W115]